MSHFRNLLSSLVLLEEIVAVENSLFISLCLLNLYKTSPFIFGKFCYNLKGRAINTLSFKVTVMSQINCHGEISLSLDIEPTTF